MVGLFANSRDPDQMPHSVVSDLGLHCWPVTFLGISGLQWVNILVVLFGITSLKVIPLRTHYMFFAEKYEI